LAQQAVVFVNSLFNRRVLDLFSEPFALDLLTLRLVSSSPNRWPKLASADVVVPDWGYRDRGDH